MLESTDYVLFLGVAARLLLALSAVVHHKAVEIVTAHDSTLSPGSTSSSLWLAPLFWVAAVLTLVAEVALGTAVLVGGAIALPLLAATGTLLDGLARWQFLHGPPPAARVLAGGVLATAATAAAARFAPDARALPSEDMWRALWTLPGKAVLGGLVVAVCLAQAALDLPRLPSHLAVLHAAQAALCGAIGALASAALGSCVRSEWAQLRHAPFDSPCALELAVVVVAATVAQGRLLRAAYRLGDPAAVGRVHGTVLLLVAPAAIAVLFAAEAGVAAAPEDGASPSPPALLAHGGFSSARALLGFMGAVAIAIVSVALVHRPRGGLGLSATQLLPPSEADSGLAAQLAPLLSSISRGGRESPTATRSPARSTDRRRTAGSGSSSSVPPLLGPADGSAAGSAAGRLAAAAAKEGAVSSTQRRRLLGGAPLSLKDLKVSLVYVLPPSPKAPSFRPSAPLLAFDAASREYEKRATLYPRAHARATAGQKQHQQHQQHQHQHQHQQHQQQQQQHASSTPGRVHARTWTGSPEFIKGHPAAEDVETLWQFTGQLRARGVLAEWPPPGEGEAYTADDGEGAEWDEAAVGSPGVGDEAAAQRMARAAAAREVAAREEAASLLRWVLIVLLGLLTIGPPFVGWEVSGRTMPHDELVLIGMSCLTLACAVHDAALRACLHATSFGGGEAPRLRPLRLPGDDEGGAAPPGLHATEAETPREPDEEVLRGRFIQRQQDVAFEARLKATPPARRGAEDLPDDEHGEVDEREQPGRGEPHRRQWGGAGGRQPFSNLYDA